MINVNKNGRRFSEFSRLGIGIIFLFVLLNACKPKTIYLKSPPGYNFQMSESQHLDSKLREISGIAWDRKKNFFIAEEDEDGILYTLDKSSKNIMTTNTFGEKGDYEDVALIDTIPYILRSDGTIFKYNSDPSKGPAGIEMGKLVLPGKNDFESLYYDPARKALVMVCKNCAIDQGKKVSAFAYYPDSIGFDQKPLYQIDLDSINKLAPQKTSRFQPSAAAIHPRQQKLYILSSASKQLAITDLDGNVEGVYVLASKMFPQPEGICFQKDGEMYISNEGGNGRATLLSFHYTDINSNDSSGKSAYNFTKPGNKMELGKQNIFVKFPG